MRDRAATLASRRARRDFLRKRSPRAAQPERRRAPRVLAPVDGRPRARDDARTAPDRSRGCTRTRSSRACAPRSRPGWPTTSTGSRRRRPGRRSTSSPSALPLGTEQREIGRRVLARLLAADAATFVADRPAHGARRRARARRAPGIRARIALVTELPIGCGVADGPLALALASRRELAREWIGEPSTGSLPSRRLAARLLERAAREAARRAGAGGRPQPARLQGRRDRRRRGSACSPIASRSSGATSRSRAGCSRRGCRRSRKEMEDGPGADALADRVAARGRVDRGLRRRGPRARARARPARALAGAARSRSGRGGGVPVGAAARRRGRARGGDRAARARPRARERRHRRGRHRSAHGARGVAAWSRRPSAPRARAPGGAPEGQRATTAPRRIALEVSRDLEGRRRDDEPVRAQIARALRRVRDAAAPRRRTPAPATSSSAARGSVDALEAVSPEEDGADGRAGSIARRTSLAVLRDLDTSLLEHDVLAHLLLARRRRGRARRPTRRSTACATGWPSGSSPARACRSTRRRGRAAPPHPTLSMRRLRALLHLADGDVGDDESDPPRAARRRKRCLRIARALLDRVERGPPSPVRRTIVAALARSLDALVRVGACDVIDAFLLVGARHVVDPAELLDARRGGDEPGARARPRSATPSSPRPRPTSRTRPSARTTSSPRDLALEASSRSEALRTVLVRLGSALRRMMSAESLRALAPSGGSEPEVVSSLETALASLAQLALGARGRLDPESAPAVAARRPPAADGRRLARALRRRRVARRPGAGVGARGAPRGRPAARSASSSRRSPGSSTDSAQGEPRLEQRAQPARRRGAADVAAAAPHDRRLLRRARARRGRRRLGVRRDPRRGQGRDRRRALRAQGARVLGERRAEPERGRVLDDVPRRGERAHRAARSTPTSRASSRSTPAASRSRSS